MSGKYEIRVLTIVVTYNAEPWLERCLSSVAKSRVKSDVMVVDNASTDATVAHIQRDFPEVNLVKNVQNLGFGAANNIGLRYAVDNCYDYVLLLNQDAWIDDDMLERLLRAEQSSHDNPGVLSPVHLEATHASIEAGFASYTGLKAVPKKASDTAPVKVDFINAAIWLLPVSVVKTVGFFSPLFYHYGEDKDYCNRLRYKGYSIVYIKEAQAVHARQQRPLSTEKRYRLESVFALSEYTNPNYSFVEAFARAVFGQLKKAFVTPSLARHSHFAIMLWLVGKTTQVIKQRKQTC